MPPPSFEPAACAGHGFSTSASLLMRGEPRLRCRKANLVRRLSSIKPLELPVPLLTAERLMDGPELQFRNVRFTPNSGHFPRGPICPLSAKSGHGRVRKERQNDGTDGHQDIEYCHRLFL